MLFRSPGGVVVFAYGTRRGEYLLGNVGVTLGISDPVFVAMFVTPLSGHAQMLLRVPKASAGQELTFQTFQQAPDPHTSQLVPAGVSGLVSSLALPSLVSSIVPVGSGLKKTGTVEFTVVFREDVRGLSASDFELAAGPDVSGAQITGLRGSGTTYTVTVETGTGDGRVALDLKDDTPLAAALGLDPTRTRNGQFEGEAFTLHNTAQDVNLLDKNYLITANRSGVLPGATRGFMEIGRAHV